MPPNSIWEFLKDMQCPSSGTFCNDALSRFRIKLRGLKPQLCHLLPRGYWVNCLTLLSGFSFYGIGLMVPMPHGISISFNPQKLYKQCQKHDEHMFVWGPWVELTGDTTGPMNFPGAQFVKNPPATQETWVPSLSREHLLEKEMATYSRILAWEDPMGRGAWWATVQGVAKTQTRLSDYATTTTIGPRRWCSIRAREEKFHLYTVSLTYGQNHHSPKCVFQKMFRSVQVDQNQLQFFKKKLRCEFTEWTGCLEKTCPSKSMVTAWKLSRTFMPPDIRWIYLSPRTEPHSEFPSKMPEAGAKPGSSTITGRVRKQVALASGAEPQVHPSQCVLMRSVAKVIEAITQILIVSRRRRLEIMLRFPVWSWHGEMPTHPCRQATPVPVDKELVH